METLIFKFEEFARADNIDVDLKAPHPLSM